MKRLLLSTAMLACAIGSNAQSYYPSGNITTPTWEYQYVVAEGDGRYNNPKTGKNGCVIDDASLDFYTFNRGDAYDGAFEFFVKTQDSVYTESGKMTVGGETVDTTGTTITLDEQLIDGLFVSKSYYFSSTEPVVRAAFKIRNPSASPVSTKIGIYSNMGSDGATQMDTSSTDGVSLVDADRWMVTSDGYSYNSGDPINTWVRFGPGTVQSSPKFGQMPESSSDDYLDTFALTVPASSYSLILQFNRLDSTRAAARTNTAKFNTVASLQAAGYLAGMSNSDLDKVVNWDFSSVTALIQGTTDVSANITVYPVPANQNVTIGLGDVINGATTISIKDMSGVSLMSKNTSKGAGTSYETLDVSELESGMYIVEIKNNEKIAYKKLIKN